MAIAVDVQAGSPYGNINAESGSITVVGKISWANLGGKLAELFPSSTTGGLGANPYDPLFGIYRCQSVEFKPIGADPKVNYGTPAVSSHDSDFTMPVYEYAWLTITYSSQQVEFPNASGDTPDTPDGSTQVVGLQHQLTSGGEIITLDDSSLVWSDTKSVKGTNVSATKVVATIEHNVTWNRVLSPPWASMRELIGKVNDANLGPFQTGTMYVETLLYLGFTATPDITADGVRVWNIGYRFSERRVDELTKDAEGGTVTADGVAGYESQFGGWNHFYKQEDEKDAFGNLTATSGFKRLHTRRPLIGGYLTYNEDTAVHKKADLTALFVQV
tara:strand:+ start:8549 stop:9538 length:990 start_codon:yes stop_codon:yes gene_type:complete